MNAGTISTKASTAPPTREIRESMDSPPTTNFYAVSLRSGTNQSRKVISAEINHTQQDSPLTFIEVYRLAVNDRPNIVLSAGTLMSTSCEPLISHP